MFTGLVEEVGTIADLTSLGDSIRLTIQAPLVTGDATHGASIAVDGCCLTVTDHGDGRFAADVMQESLDRTSLGSLAVGSRVNLERAAALGDRLGGHIVQGHVDATGTLTAIEPSEHWTVLRFEVPEHLSRYLVEKGSVTVSGVSLTVVEIGDTHFTVSLIPTTLADTTLGSLEVGATVNLEADVLAKHVERLLQKGAVPHE